VKATKSQAQARSGESRTSLTSAGLPYAELSDLLISHPALSEGIVALISAVAPK
jgi:hypothetical protein